MKSLLFIIFLLLAGVFACTNNKDQKAVSSENDVDAARNFIQAALEGKWSAAKQFMVQDSVNTQLLESAESQYQNKSSKEKAAYQKAHPIFYDSRKINDSIVIINYANTYMNKKDSLKIVRINGQWLIDLKYSLLPTDSFKNAQ